MGEQIELWKWAFTTGGPMLVLVIYMFVMQRKDQQANAIAMHTMSAQHAEAIKQLAAQHVGDVKEFSEKWKGQSETLVLVVKENTAAITGLKTMIEQESHRK